MQISWATSTMKRIFIGMCTGIVNFDDGLLPDDLDFFFV